MEPGFYAGADDGDPAKFRLERKVYEGGEGTVWLAVSDVDGGDARWALKILRAEHVEARHGESSAAAMRRWKSIWKATIDRTAVLGGVPGLIPATDAFVGAAPHRHPQPSRGADRALYLVTRWVDGPDLATWHRHHGDELPAVVDVVTQLCDVVDRLAERGWVHRDLCPRNVMLDETGRVCLIDFAFMLRAGGDAEIAVAKAGYTAPEADPKQLRDRRPSVQPAVDRYSVGAVVYRLLTGQDPPRFAARREVHRSLVDHGFRDALAGHVAALLHPEPGHRPDRLVPWAQEFGRLVRPSTTRGYCDVAITVDGARETTVLAAGTEHVATARLSPTAHLVLRPDPSTPLGVETVAAARRGRGDLAVFARDEANRLHLRTAGRWAVVPGVQARGAVRAAELGDGAVSAFLVGHDAHLVEVTVPLDGPPAVVAHAAAVRRVYAAVAGPGGRAVVAAETPDGMLLCGPPDALGPVGLSGIGTAALCTNAYDELVCVAARPGDTCVDVVGSPGGEWSDRERHDTPTPVRGVACTWLRTGLAVATAGDEGVWVSGDDVSGWTPLWRGPATQVVLSPGVGWRLQLAALAEGRVLFAEEIEAGRWPQAAAQL
jgi:hypothetical protein